MIAFHKMYTYLFPSFEISGEIELLEKIRAEGVQEVLIIKRSWVFILYLLYFPLLITLFMGVSTYFSLMIDNYYFQIGITSTLVLNMIIFLWIQCVFVYRYKGFHKSVEISSDFDGLISSLRQIDVFFVRFFNWSLLLQIIVFIVSLVSLYFIFFENSKTPVWYHIAFILPLFFSFFLIGKYRKRVIDLEMDYNLAYKGKIYFVNQSGVLSSVQVIEANKIKSIQSSYPSALASFFKFGNVHILTEGDDRVAMGTMSMYYVTEPDFTVQKLYEILQK